MKRFSVVIAKSDGGVEIYPMKEWLRQHPEHIPPGLDATSSTSHQLRNGLKKQGWSVSETSTEARLSMPGAAGPELMINEALGEETEGDQDGERDASFALEYQLRDFVAENLDTISIEGKRLRLYVDPTGRDGIEYPSATGPIDILAVDEGGAFIVFELKRARTPDRAIGQLARYMGWVRETVGRGHEVYGVIVAKTIGDNLRYAASVFPKVGLFGYSVEFHLRRVQRPPNTATTSA